MRKRKIVPCWHSHHDGSTPVGFVDFDERVEDIRRNKPQREHAIRFKYFHRVKGKLPKKFVTAGRAYSEAEWACEKAGRAYNNTWRDYNKAWLAYSKVVRDYNKTWRDYNKAVMAYNKTWLDYGKAGRAYDKAARAYNEAERAYDEAARECLPKIMALHTVECGCPWTPQNSNILKFARST